MLPLPLALMATLSAAAVPSFNTMDPNVLVSTMEPLPAVVTKSDCVASVCVDALTLPSVLTRFTVRPTSLTVTPSVSSK